MTVADSLDKRLASRTEDIDLREDQALYEEEIRYCWVDEDGIRMSPVHKNFGAALSFVTVWPKHWARITEREAEIQQKIDETEEERKSRWDYEASRIADAKSRLSRTGKPPNILRRLIISTRAEGLVEHEEATVTALMKGTEL